MVILVALFTWIYQRDKQQRVRLWMIGWSAILMHFGAALLASFNLIPSAFADWLCYATLIAAAASFLVSVCSNSRTWRWLSIFLWGLVAPAIVYAALLSAGTQTPFPYALILIVMWSAGFYLAQLSLWRMNRAGIAVAVSSASATIWTAWKAGAVPEYGLDLILFSAFAVTAHLFWRHYERVSPGVALTCSSFLLWGLVFPLGSLSDYLHAGIPDDHVVWDLPKYAVAFGMILLLFEGLEELLRVEVDERRRAEDRALAASEAKSHFLANMSHEIRTPMNGILGVASLMLDSGDLTAAQRDNLELVRTSAQSLLLVINDILDFSKIEAGKLSLEKIEFNPTDLVLDVVRFMRLRAEQKGLQMFYEMQPGVPRGVIGDPSRLRQVLLNLLSNAIKFTELGQVSLRLERKEATVDGEALLRFSVTDSGIGIPVEKQQVIFQPFYQTDHSNTRRFGGTGLGLAIASELVTLMGGRLMVESNRGGSVFSFEVCMGVTEPQAQDITQLAKAVAQSGSGRTVESSSMVTAPSAAARSLRILVAEDNRVNQLVITRLMEKQGHTVAVTASGREAIAALNRDTFDVILMDIHMPELDGLQATRLIRAREQNTGHHIPIIAVTAFAMKGDAEKCLEAGMDAYISKPIQASELFLKINQLV
jgi:signal transduction histidine kinase/ActR/RegA family two-component response regulator